MKRAVYGNFHNVSEAHLHRYLSEFDFQYNHRCALGYDDAARAAALLRGAKGKRLLYQWPNEAQHAQTEGEAFFALEDTEWSLRYMLA